MTIGVESRFTSALGLRPPWAARDARLDTAHGRIDVDLGCEGATLACPACGTGSQPVRDRLRRSWRHLDPLGFETWLHCDVPRVACGHCGRHTDVPVPWARSGAGYTAAFEALAFALCIEGPVAQAASLLRCTDTRFWGAVAFHADQARDRGMFLGRQSPGVDRAGFSHGVPGRTSLQDLGHDVAHYQGTDPGTDRGIEGPPWSAEGRGPATLDAFVAALKAHGGDPESTHRFWLAARAVHAQGDHGARGLILALAQARTGEERFRALALAMDAMVPVLRVPLRGSAVAAPQAQHHQTFMHRFMRRIWAWGTRRWAHPARLDAYGTAAAIRHERFMPLAPAAASHRGHAVFGGASGLVRRVKAAWEEFRSALYFTSQSMGHAVLRALRLTRGPADPLMLANGARLWGRRRKGMESLALLLLIPVLAQAAVQNLIFFAGDERVRDATAGPVSRTNDGFVARAPGWIGTERTEAPVTWGNWGREVPRWVAFEGGMDDGGFWNPVQGFSSSFEGELRGMDAVWRQRNAWNDALLGPFDVALGARLGGAEASSQELRSFSALGTNGAASSVANVGVTAPVPEPGTLTLALAGVAMLALSPGLRRRLRRH